MHISRRRPQHLYDRYRPAMPPAPEQDSVVLAKLKPTLEKLDRSRVPLL